MHLKNQAPLILSLRAQCRLFRLAFSSNSNFKCYCKFNYFFIFFCKFVLVCFKKPVSLFSLLQIRFKSYKICFKKTIIFKRNKTNVFVGLSNCFLKVLQTSKFCGRNFDYYLATQHEMKKSPRFQENDRERSSLIRPVFCRIAGCGWLFQLMLLLQLSAPNASEYLIQKPYSKD